MAVALMASIWFMVLKVVLILFLVIILFILLVVGIVLLSPAKYKIRAEKYDVIKIESNISWLFGIIRVLVLYDDGKHSYNIKIFGVNYNKFNHCEKEKHKDKKKEILDYNLEGEKHEEKDISKDTGKKTSGRKEDKTTRKEDKKSKENRKNSTGSQQNSWKRNSKETNSSGKIHKKETKKAKPKKKENNDEKNNGRWQTISKIKEFVFADNTKGVVSTAKNSLIHLLLKIKPRKIKSDILFGTGDACLTGQALGAIAVYMAVTNTVLNITPDFENRVLKGRLEVLGRIRAASFLLAVLKIVLDRHWKSFYRDLKKVKEEII